MLNRFSKLLALTFFISIMSGVSFAYDTEILCKENKCDTVGAASLFNEFGWYPGSTATKTFHVRNEDSETCDLTMYTMNETQSPSTFASRLFTVITKNGGARFGSLSSPGVASSEESLQEVFQYYIGLGKVGANGGSDVFDWTITFDRNSGNEYQNAITTMDFEINFTCKKPSSGGGKTFHSHDDNSDGDSTGDTPSTTPVAPAVFVPAGQVEGISTQATSSVPVPSVPTTAEPSQVASATDQKGEVAGTSTCSDPWWWWLLFVVQIAAMTLVYFGVDSDGAKSPAKFYIVQTLGGTLFGFIFWKFFCPWWDMYLSIVISLLYLVGTWKRVQDVRDSGKRVRVGVAK